MNANNNDLTMVSDTLYDTTAKIGQGTLTGVTNMAKLSGTISVTEGRNTTVVTAIPGGSSQSGTYMDSYINQYFEGYVQGIYHSATGTINFTSFADTSLYPFSIDASNLYETKTATGAVGASLSYTPGGAYNIGLTGDATNKVYDTTSGQTSGAPASFTANTPAAGGVATLSYTDSAGQDLSTTDLTSQANAESALNAINTAISDVSAQDGYVGSQINTLNAVGQVLGVQKQNVQATQNDIQATDYASATSEMSKHEILIQTGIAALAQANSVQQEVTKLLQ
jgi:flagellin